MRRGDRHRRSRAGHFAQYNTDSEDDSASFVSSSETSSFFSDYSESLPKDPDWEPSDVSAPGAPESLVPPDGAAFQHRVAIAQRRRQRRDARIKATSPSVARLTLLEVLSIILLVAMSTCCILSGHPLLVILLFICLVHPLKVVCPVLDHTERRDDMADNDAREAAAVRERGTAHSKGGAGESMGEGGGGAPHHAVSVPAADDFSAQKVTAAQEAKHEKYLKAVFREARDEMAHGAKASLALVGGDGDGTVSEPGGKAQAVAEVTSCTNEPFLMGSDTGGAAGVKEAGGTPSVFAQEPRDDGMAYDATPSRPLTLEHLRAHDNHHRQMRKGRVVFTEGFEEVEKPADDGVLKAVSPNDPRAKSAAPSESRAPPRPKTVRFVDDAAMRERELAARAKALQGNSANGADRLDYNTVFGALDGESRQDEGLLNRLRLKLHRKRKLTFGESSFIDGDVGPNTFFIMRRSHVLAVIAYCILYFIAALVVESGFSSGGTFENSYTTASYKFDRSRLFYLQIPFLERWRNDTNAAIDASNAARNETNPTIPPIDETVYYRFHPQIYLLFSLFVSDMNSGELTLAVVALAFLMILGIILFVSLPKKIRYYDHQDEKQRRDEGLLNYVHDSLFSTVKDGLAASLRASRRDMPPIAATQPNRVADGKGPSFLSPSQLRGGGSASWQPQTVLPSATVNDDPLAEPPRMVVIGAVVGVDAELNRQRMAADQQSTYLQYWTDADMRVASAVLTVNTLTHVLQQRLAEATAKGGKGIGECRFDYVPQYANRHIRVAHLSLLLASLLVVIAVLPSLMVCAPGFLILCIVATVFFAPPPLATAGPPLRYQVIPGEDRPRRIRFAYHCWSPASDRATRYRSVLTSLLFYTLCVVFAAYVAFQNPMFEDFNKLPDSFAPAMPFSGAQPQSSYYHRAGLYNIRTFISMPISVDAYAQRLRELNNETLPPQVTNQPSAPESLDVDNGLGIADSKFLTGRIIAQMCFLFVAIILARALPSSLFVVMMPEYDEDRAFMRQVTRLKAAQRTLMRRVRRLTRSDEVPSLEMPHFDERGYVPPSAASASASPPRGGRGGESPASTGLSPSPLRGRDAADDVPIDPLKGLDDSAKEAAANVGSSTALERALQLTTSFIRAMLALIYALVFRFSPVLLLPAYAVYCCASPSLITAFVMFPLVLAYCFVGRRRRMVVCRLLFVAEVMYLSALVIVFALELQYDGNPVLRWLLIGGRPMQRSLNLSTCNFILGMHALCLMLVVSTILVMVAAVTGVDDEEADALVSDTLSTSEQIEARAARPAEEKEAAMRRYAVDLDVRTQKDKANGEKRRQEAEMRRTNQAGAVITAQVSRQILAADEGVAAIIAHNAEAESPYHMAPMVEVSHFVRERSEHFRRKWRVQAVLEANNILGGALVKKITALYECRFDADPLTSHKRLLEVNANVHRSVRTAFTRAALERLRTYPPEVLATLDVAEFARRFSQELTVSLVEEALMTNIAAVERARGGAGGITNGTFAGGNGLALAGTIAEVTEGMLSGEEGSGTSEVLTMDAKKWAKLVCTLQISDAVDSSGFYRLASDDVDAYAALTEHYASDFEAIRANVLPHVAWDLTSAELVVIHRYVQYYCPAPRFGYEAQNGVRAHVPSPKEADTADPRPMPADGSPFAEAPINLDDLLLICACFKAGGSFLERAKVFGAAGRHRRDAVLSVLEQDEHFCKRDDLEAGGPLRKLRALIAANVEAMQKGANEGRGEDFDANITARMTLMKDWPPSGGLTFAGMNADADEDSMGQEWPVDPALQSAARHVNFCYQHKLMEMFPTRAEREEQRRLQAAARKALRAVERERIRDERDHRNTINTDSFQRYSFALADTHSDAHRLSTFAGARASTVAGTALPHVPVEGEEDEESESFFGRIARVLRELAAEVYMWLRRRGDSIYTLCHRLLIMTYFVVAVVGFCVAGYRDYFTFLHFGLMLMLVGVLWSQIFNISKQIYLLNAYIALTAFSIVAIIVMTCIAEEMMTSWPGDFVFAEPIPGTGNNTQPLLVSIGVQGFQRTPWELLLYFLQLFVLMVQRREYLRVRRAVMGRARLLHMSLPEKAPSIDDEDDIDVRFELSSWDNRWNVALDPEAEAAAAAAQQQMRPTLRGSLDIADLEATSDTGDGNDEFILNTEGVEGDVVPVEVLQLVSENSWRSVKAWVEWRLLMTSPVFIRLQMYVAVIVGTPMFVAVEGFTTPNYWTMFFLIFFICLLTYSIKSDAFETRLLQLLWLWALVISTVATLTTAMYQSDPFQSFIRLKFGELLEKGRFVGNYCARTYFDGSDYTSSSMAGNSSTAAEVVNFCLEEIGYQSFLYKKATLNGYSHFAIIFVVSVVEYALLRQYQQFHAHHPMPQREVENAEDVEERRRAKIDFLRGTTVTESLDADSCPSSTTSSEDRAAAGEANKGVGDESVPMPAPAAPHSEPPASLGFMNTLTVFILTLTRDNCEKLHWAMCIVAALHVRSLTHAIYVLFFVAGLTGWVPLAYSALHIAVIYFYPISLFGEYWGAKQMEWVGIAKNTSRNEFSNKVTIMVGPALVFLASLLYLNTVRFSRIENCRILHNARTLQRQLEEQVARERAAAALRAAGGTPTDQGLTSVNVGEASIFMSQSRRGRILERRRAKERASMAPHGNSDEVTPPLGPQSDDDGNSSANDGQTLSPSPSPGRGRRMAEPTAEELAEEEQAVRRAHLATARSMAWEFVLFVYHDFALTMGYEVLLLGLLVFMAVDTIRLMSCFFFLSVLVMLFMGREWVVTSRLFLLGSQIFYGVAVVALQWLYIGHPYGTALARISATYKEEIAATKGDVRYDGLKYVGVYPDAALVWTTAITAYLFRWVYSQRAHLVGKNYPAAVIAVPTVVVREKARAAGTLPPSAAPAPPPAASSRRRKSLSAPPPPPPPVMCPYDTILMVFGTTPEIIAYFDDTITSLRMAGRSLAFLRPVGMVTGALGRKEAGVAKERREEQSAVTRKRKAGDPLPTPKEADVERYPEDVAVDAPETAAPSDRLRREGIVEGPADLYSGPLSPDQRALLLQMLTSRDSSVRYRAKAELERTYLKCTSTAPDGSASSPSTKYSATRLDATNPLAVAFGAGFVLTPSMAAMAERARAAYEDPSTVAEWAVWLLMCVYAVPCFVFADAVCGGSILHFAIGVMAVFMIVRRGQLSWRPQPMWGNFIAFYVLVLFAQVICQIPPIAKLIEQNVSTPKVLGFAGYAVKSAYYNDGTAPAEPVMPLTPFRVMAIFMVVLQRRIFNSFAFLYHLIEVHDKAVDAVGRHERLQSRQAANEKADDDAVADREVRRSAELMRMRQEIASKEAANPNGATGAAVIDVGGPLSNAPSPTNTAVPPVLRVPSPVPVAKTLDVNEDKVSEKKGSPRQPLPKALSGEAVGEADEAHGAAEDLLSPLHASDDADADGEGGGKKSRGGVRKFIEKIIKRMNRASYMEVTIDPTLPIVAQLFVATAYLCLRYSVLILTVLIAINFIVSGSLVDLLPFFAMVIVAAVWRPWAPRLVYVCLLYYVGGSIILKMIVRILADWLTVNAEQARILSAFFLNMPPNAGAGIRPSDLNRVNRANVIVVDLVFDFIVLAAIQLHLHMADRVGVYAAGGSEEDGSDEDDALSDMTQYSTDEEDAATFGEARAAERRLREHHLHYAVQERMTLQRHSLAALLKMNRPHTNDYPTTVLMRQDDQENVAVVRQRQEATLGRGRANLTQWDLWASGQGITGAAGTAKDRTLADADAEGDILKDPPPTVVVWAGSFSSNLGAIAGLGIDLYTITFFWEILTLIVTIFVYPELAGRNTGSIVQAVEDNLLPGPLLAILLIFTLIMVADRILYTYSARNAPKANLLKWIFLAFLTLAYGGAYIYWLNEICARVPKGGPVVMTMKAIYIMLGAFQVYAGYPLFRQHDPFTRRTGLSSIGWTVLLAIPFLWDLRMYLDWCFTRTSLPFEDYLKVEEVHLEVYGRYCRAEDQAEKKGTDQGFKDRCLTAGLWFIVIFLIIFFPLMYFSGFNPRLEDNPIDNVGIALRLDGFGALYRSERYVPYSQSSQTTVRTIEQLYPALELNDYFRDRLFQYIEADKCSADVWGISPQGIDELLLMGPSDFMLNLEVSMTRQNAVASDLQITTVNTVALTKENGQRLQDLIRYSLAVPFDPSMAASPPPPVMLYNVYDPFLRNSPSNIEPFSSTSNFGPYPVDCQLNINVVPTNISGTEQYVRNWCLTCRSLFLGGNDPNAPTYSAADQHCLTHFEGCEPYNYEDPTSGASRARPTDINGVFFAVVSDEVPRRLALIPSDTGIIALYATFVLALAGWVRQRLEGAIHRVVLEECQDPQTLGTYVRYIWMSRGGGRPDRGYDLILEEDLYLEMIDLLRAPDELLRRTKRRQQCYDHAGDRVDISHVPKW